MTLESAIKVGRSVARVKPALNNAIFDCKVLSRNHALFWYKDGKVNISNNLTRKSRNMLNSAPPISFIFKIQKAAMAHLSTTKG